jgi:carboxyl-terminal processing protease
MSRVSRSRWSLSSNRGWLAVAVLAAGCGVAGFLARPPLAQAQQAATARQAQARQAPAPRQPQPQQVASAAPARQGAEVASVEQVKSQALQALRSGKFDQVNELVGRAATASRDPTITKMADWTKGFESQRQEFAAERHKSYDKAVGEVKLLADKGKADFAIDRAARAFLLADDKQKFHDEPWVKDLIARTVRQAEQYDGQEQWIKSLRLYSDLGSIEPANPLWKERLKAATRRVRLLALYTPDEFRKIQDVEQKAAEEVDGILNPTTQPSDKPARDKKKDADNDAFRIDWRETLRGVQGDMLWSALQATQEAYYRDVTYLDLLRGGLNGLRAVVTTKGLESAFPNLGDQGKRELFIRDIDRYLADVKSGEHKTEGQQLLLLRSALAMLKSRNRQTVQIPDEVFVSEFADGAFAELDPFTSMIWPSDLEDFNRTTQGEFSGVGIQIQLDEDGSLKVVSPLEDSPAYKAGIKAGDVITHINGKNAKGISLNQAVKSITGASGTFVTLTVRSTDSKVRDYAIKRETIKVASVKGWLHKPGGGWQYMVDPENRIGYLRMTNFTKDTAKELDQALAVLDQEGARGVILDLRYNPGGLLTAATDVTDKFLPDGVIVSTRPDRDTGNPPTVAKASPNGESKLPLVVLVNQYSASASEIVSGALKDQHRATVVGERTFGKGSVQMLFPLNDRTAYLKLTTSHYYLPSGRCIHREENSTEWGVDPDVTVEMTPEQMRAAIDARQDLDILRDAQAAPAEGEQKKLNDKAPEVQAATEAAKDKADAPKVKKDLLSADPQLSAAVLLLRLQLAGGTPAAQG